VVVLCVIQVLAPFLSNPAHRQCLSELTHGFMLVVRSQAFRFFNRHSNPANNSALAQKKAGLFESILAEEASGNPANWSDKSELVLWFSVPRSPGVWQINYTKLILPARHAMSSKLG